VLDLAPSLPRLRRLAPGSAIIAVTFLIGTRLAYRFNRRRFLWRLRAPVSPSETRRVERWLATSRVWLAMATFVTVFARWLQPGNGGSGFALPGLACYFLASVFLMFLFRYRETPPSSVRWIVHGIDTLWPVLLATFAQEQATAYFLFFFFALLAAAYRFGLWETLITAFVVIALPIYLAAALTRLHVMAATPPELEASRLFERAVSLLVMALLLGYLAEQEKEMRAEKAFTARLLGKARVEAGMSGTLREILQEMLLMYGARQAFLAAAETHSYRIFLGRSDLAKDFSWLPSEIADHDRYFFPTPARVWHASRAQGSWKFTALDADGNRLRDPDSSFVAPLAQAHEFSSIACVGLDFGKEWRGRIFLLDPALIANRPEELRFMLELVGQVGPAVYNVFLLRRLRQRAGAVERARVARELHDGAIQSVIASQMQVELLRRQAETKGDPFANDLDRLQKLLREEALKLRDLMQNVKSSDVDGRSLPGFLADQAERFQREAGIKATFVSIASEVHVPTKVCRELARIAQEALINIRKHSRAANVVIRLDESDGNCQLIVEDDGKGFDFSGRLSQDELEALRQGPLVIRERVRLIDGQLTVESNPGKGARLEVTVLLPPEPNHG